MLFKNPRKLLSEAASADLLDPTVSAEVKDVVDDLEDILTNNIEEVKDEDKTTNGMPLKVEAVAMMESANPYGKARYLLKIEDLMAELRENYTVVIVTHNMQQAARISDYTAFFLVGEMVEFNTTDEIFARPKDKRTEDYITGRFG